MSRQGPAPRIKETTVVYIEKIAQDGGSGRGDGGQVGSSTQHYTKAVSSAAALAPRECKREPGLGSFLSLLIEEL